MSLTAGWEFTAENYLYSQNDRILEIQESYWLAKLRKSPDQSWLSLWIACPTGYYGAQVSGRYSLGTTSPHQTGQGAMKLAVSALVGMFPLQTWPSKWRPAFMCSLIPIGPLCMTAPFLFQRKVKQLCQAIGGFKWVWFFDWSRVEALHSSHCAQLGGDDWHTCGSPENLTESR